MSSISPQAKELLEFLVKEYGLKKAFTSVEVELRLRRTNKKFDYDYFELLVRMRYIKPVWEESYQITEKGIKSINEKD